MATSYSPIMEHEQGGHDYEGERSTASGCNCFQLFSFKWHQNNDYENRHLLNRQKGDNQHEESWVMRQLKKVKEVSEVVAGPKWKTFIRKVGGYIKNTKKQKNNYDNQFHYDPESYALNFDAGVDREDDLLLPVFSSKLAAVPSSNSSVEDKRQKGL
ncbi:hypothetical protein P3X46_035278 [Hevea brasiliensis]|uniref:Stress induced protein n=1 Tax=Hevea brasiliensis TaxID=3981 RepID=A0ABQ9KDI2_HEVBR|nr:uncharacterized protein LOC110666538 [Hevea brasiliensis]KAJ9131192.1 hypothetical protein P3X46_035278 [Hevea brasiliensis]